MAERLPTSREPATRPRLWLAAIDGKRVSRPEREVIAPIGEPETLLEIEFEGLSEAEQRAALDGFPGGKRFILKRRH